MSKYRELDLSGVKRFPFAERPTKVDVSMFGRPRLDDDSFSAFFAGLPEILVARDFKHVAARTAEILRAHGKVVAMMGAHLIKTGLSPLFCELIARGAISCLVMNGAGAIHDFEVALFGRTSEDVATHLETGRFGFVEETGILINEAVREGADQGWGYGEAVARKLEQLELAHPEQSLLLTCLRHDVPVTVHVALGTETIHQHPETDGAAIGETSYRDFRILCNQLTGLEGGIVFLYGSAVILPEVFLKALTVVRNLGHPVKHFTAVNFDMIRHYRPQENVVSRPTRTGGEGYTIIGHHELMIPLFWQAVYSLLRGK
jgi:Arginine dihydrolase ArgZ-like, C-terminal, Rossmann fold